MDKLGISNEEIDQLSDQMMDMLDGDSFEMGGSGLMPNFLSNMFGISHRLKRNRKMFPIKNSQQRKTPLHQVIIRKTAEKKVFSRERIKNQKNLNSSEHTVLTFRRKQPTASLIILSAEIRKLQELFRYFQEEPKTIHVL